MFEDTSNFFAIIIFLLPGFLAAWIFYGVTSHPKPTQFERTIQALIFAFIVQLFVSLLHWLFSALGNITGVLRPWDHVSEGFASLFLAVLLGVALAYFTNMDSFHRQLRKRGFTTRTSHPSEWCYVFSEKVLYVILHLKNGMRLYRYPKEWPEEPGKGHFHILYPSWILEDQTQVDLPGLDGILIGAEDVQWVEFVKSLDKQDEEKNTSKWVESTSGSNL